ncbi:phosphatase PAP2 family protein [Enterococcus canintestini]|uniref:phosphatase PAP2 family protein n=1 Tax=Enterococcus canintestini TaxID=317010 RepID=UPI00288D771D|nr:phosphatase PAP2 family protein [Enterococcus canintestini]MDT2740612.1 phosphatase PAP2 family protein [Enterococcus canintestini]
MTNLDNQLFYSINGLAGKNTLLDTFFILVAKYSPIFLLLFFLIRWFFSKEIIETRKNLFIAFFSGCVTIVLGRFAGLFYGHTQPFTTLQNVHKLINHPIDNSFPSDHTLLFFGTLTVLFLSSKNVNRYWFLLVAALVGLSRIWVGVHYPIDVLFGALIGIIGAYLSIWISQRASIFRTLNNKISHLFLPKNK